MKPSNHRDRIAYMIHTLRLHLKIKIIQNSVNLLWQITNKMIIVEIHYQLLLIQSNNLINIPILDQVTLEQPILDWIFLLWAIEALLPESFQSIVPVFCEQQIMKNHFDLYAIKNKHNIKLQNTHSWHEILIRKTHCYLLYRHSNQNDIWLKSKIIFKTNIQINKWEQRQKPPKII